MAEGPTGPNVRKQRQQAVREAVDALYAALVAGDAKDFASYFSPDARLVVVATPALIPGGGMKIGRDDIARHVDLVSGRTLFRSHRIDDVVIDGDHVAVLWSAETVVRDTGRLLTMQMLDHLRVKDGMIVEMTQFFDSGGLAIAHGLIRIA